MASRKQSMSISQLLKLAATVEGTHGCQLCTEVMRVEVPFVQFSQEEKPKQGAAQLRT